jgi:hypothetical protein
MFSFACNVAQCFAFIPWNISKPSPLVGLREDRIIVLLVDLENAARQELIRHD